MDDRRLRVLVVDDHDVVHWGFRVLLGEQPWVERFFQARTGAEALALARAHKPQVALVDLFLAGESGAELCESIRQASPSTRSNSGMVACKPMRANSARAACSSVTARAALPGNGTGTIGRRPTRTAWPAHARPNTRHDRTGVPSSSTVHVPHSPSSQPCFVPVSPRSSRNTSSSVLCGANATSSRSPFTSKVIVAMT